MAHREPERPPLFSRVIYRTPEGERVEVDVIEAPMGAQRPYATTYAGIDVASEVKIKLPDGSTTWCQWGWLIFTEESEAHF